MCIKLPAPGNAGTAVSWRLKPAIRDTQRHASGGAAASYAAVVMMSSSLTGKEKRALRAYAQRKAKAVPTVNVGDAGLTSAVVSSAEDAISANELIKLKMPGFDREDFKEGATDVASQLGAEVVGAVGRVALVYRPSKDGKGPISKEEVLYNLGRSEQEE